MIDDLSPNFVGYEPPLVSFVTVNYKMVHFVRHLLQYLETKQPAFSFEFFLIDNGSGDGAVEMVRERFPWVRVIALPHNVGLSAANNQALKEARGKYILHLNPDLILFPGELEKWVTWMESRPDVGLSGPRLLNPDGTDQASCYHFPHLWMPLYRRTFLGKTRHGKRHDDYYLMREMDRAQENEVDWVLGAAMLIRRDVLEKIGHFDERFFLYFEDTDVCRRVWEEGFKVCYVPTAKLVHYYGHASRTVHPWEIIKNKTTRIHVASAIKYFLKYRKSPNPRENHLKQTHPSVESVG